MAAVLLSQEKGKSTANDLFVVANDDNWGILALTICGIVMVY